VRQVLSRLALFAILACGLAIAGCSHADYSSLYASPSPSASASGSASPTSSASASASASPTATPSSSASLAPAACGTPAPNSVFIAVGSYIEDESPTDPTYGTIYGYAIVDSAGDYPQTSSPIVLRPGDVVQFVNVDFPANGSSQGTSHSAASLQSASFPASYTFPSASFSPVGTMISNTTNWSTGEIPSYQTPLCYSQPLTVPASGTYAFGDLDFYNPNSMRDVIVVSSTAPQIRSAVPHMRR
jgi:hypothetical protein